MLSLGRAKVSDLISLGSIGVSDCRAMRACRSATRTAWPYYGMRPRDFRTEANGEGTVYRRADGRWEAAAYVLTSAGVRERRSVYGSTRAEAHGQLTKLIRQSHEGIPVAATSQTVGEYLAYWIKEVVPYRVRPLTFRTYEMVVREHLIPGF